MKNYVENQSLGKFFRTIGYMLIFATTSLMSLSLVFDESADFFMLDTIRDILQPVQDIVLDIEFLEDTFYYVLLFFVGMLLIFWTLRKRAFEKFIDTVLLVAIFGLIFYTQDMTLLPVSFVTPAWMEDGLSLVDTYINQLLDLSEFVMPLVSLLASLLIWQLFATKKPKRISTFFMRIGGLVLFIAVLSYFAALAFEDFFDTSIILNIQLYAYFASFDLFVLGSAFGILGFMRK